MYVVRTSLKFYDKRLVHLLDTWVSQVRGDAFFVSDELIPNITSDHQISTAETCGPDSHAMRLLCCKTAHDFQLYHRHASNYDWFCHFDDDQYVNVLNLEKYLADFDATTAYYIGRNSWSIALGRSKQPFPHEFWFATLGAGVCFSRRALALLRPYTSNVSSFADGCIRENYHDDIYLGFLVSGYLNVSLTKATR